MKQWMTALLTAMLLLTTGAAMANESPSEKLDDATTVLRQFVDIPENAIPSTLLRQAYGIAVIPSVLKVGFIVGGRHGKGVLAVRTDNGKWSNPSFITLTGGSIGWQAGASSTDIILVFKTRRSIDRIAKGQFTLGADASVAAGPVGRSAGASTNGNFNAEVYSYSRSRGLFAGVSVEGGHIAIDKDDNWLFYNKAGLTARTILSRSSESDLPAAGKRFVYTLNRYMPASSNKFDYNADTGANTNASGNGSGANDSPSQGQATPYQSGSGSGVTIQQRGGGNNTGGSGNDHDYGSGSSGNSQY